MLVQSGKPVGVMRTHEWAPRVLIANSNLVGDWATWPEFRRLEQLGLTMYGQMTAGSWIYIGTQGILQGTYETFAAVAAKRFGGTLAGTLTADRRVRRHGRRAAARGHHERRRLPGRRRRPRAAAAPGRARATSTRSPTTWTTRSRACAGRQARASGRCRVGVVGNCADGACPSCCAAGVEIDIVTDQTSAHDPLATCPRASTSSDWHDYAAGKPEEFTDRARASMAKHVEAMVGFLDAGAEVFDYGNSIRDEAQLGRLRAGVRLPGLRARLHPAAVLRGQGPVPLGRALRRPEGHRAPPTGRCSTCSPTTTTCAAGSELAGERVAFQGLPARICWLGYGERDQAGLRFNDMVAARRDLRADRHRPRPPRLPARSPRRTARPRRCSTAPTRSPTGRCSTRWSTPRRGATWVSIHHGGGVGIGRSHPRRPGHASPTAPPLAAREARARAHQRPGHGRDPARRRRLRPRRRGRRAAGVRVPMREG